MIRCPFPSCAQPLFFSHFPQHQSRHLPNLSSSRAPVPSSAALRRCWLTHFRYDCTSPLALPILSGARRAARCGWSLRRRRQRQRNEELGMTTTTSSSLRQRSLSLLEQQLLGQAELAAVDNVGQLFHHIGSVLLQQQAMGSAQRERLTVVSLGPRASSLSAAELEQVLAAALVVTPAAAEEEGCCSEATTTAATSPSPSSHGVILIGGCGAVDKYGGAAHNADRWRDAWNATVSRSVAGPSQQCGWWCVCLPLAEEWLMHSSSGSKHSHGPPLVAYRNTIVSLMAPLLLELSRIPPPAAAQEEHQDLGLDVPSGRNFVVLCDEVQHLSTLSHLFSDCVDNGTLRFVQL